VRNISLCSSASFSFGKVTKANSFIINNRIIYVTKKDSTGNQCSLYIAFDYKSGIQLGFSSSKEKLCKMLERLIDTEATEKLELKCMS